MAYTRPWDAINWLLGARDADEIDDGVREAGLDMDERLSSILVDVTADPWVLKAVATHMRMHWSAADLEATAPATLVRGAGVAVGAVGDLLILHFPVIAPVGTLITGGIIRCKRAHANVSVTGRLHQIDAAGAIIPVGPVVAAVVSATPQDLAFGPHTETMAVDTFYRVLVTLTTGGAAAASDAQVYGVSWTGDVLLGAP